MRTKIFLLICISFIVQPFFLGFFKAGSLSYAQTSMANITGRNATSLNGKWRVVIDLYDIADNDGTFIWEDSKPKTKSDFVEYSFDDGPLINVPGDFNSQLPDMKYFESSLWYKKTFTYNKKNDKRLFVHFGAVNYLADVYLNSKKLGSHEGGFTPFQFEITNDVKDGNNSLIVRANNRREKNNIPGICFDWVNYGGITRDVNLIETPGTFIEDYFIQLAKNSGNSIKGWVKISGVQKSQNLVIQIPEAKINYKAKSNNEGIAEIEFPAKLELWSPSNPKLYNVKIVSETDSISEEIGFRTIEVKGTDILLNEKPVFLKGVNIHEEVPREKSRAFSESDALILLSWAKELGCNFVRLSHFPYNENMVRLAERMGFMIWSEIPVYHDIDFANPDVQQKIQTLLKEMVSRDKNRCAVIIWSLSNETMPSPERDKTIMDLAQLCRTLDPTRLISSALYGIDINGNKITVLDSSIGASDVIAINEYLGWYTPWPASPGEIKWESKYNKPLIMSEFGGEACYGNHDTLNMASTWSEEYQEQLYKDQIKMFKNIPFLKGTCPWILADFRSPKRIHPIYQDGWNRKGLISDRGFKKKAWYAMKQFYDSF